MKVEEELLEKWEEEIDKWWIKNKLKFFWYGFRGDFKTIRDTLNFEKRKPNEDEVEAFIGICDNRIDRLKSFSSDIIAVLIVLVAAVASILVVGEEYPLMSLLHQPGWIFKIIFLIFLLCLLALIRYRAQIYAWYAIKEGVLLMKKNK